ncbi:hypothetical protein GCM10009789_80930 [Kribbella sancticallisti]|uniref:Sec-independent protein translocase protein TatA n=1 Tax=Kribbella sancticallisti TaxID=460087 RepID=A0ABN2ETF9_9ACTN
MIAELVALHLGGIPELAMFLGPILLIIAFLKIARRNDATRPDEDDDWDADLGDLTPADKDRRTEHPATK